MPAARDPVAQVCVDVPLPHLDRPFDYLVPDTMADSVRAGSRVRVRFAGQLVGGVVLARVASSAHAGRMEWINRATSAEPVLAPEIARLARAVADRWAGTLSDVLRLALPPRHARVEAETPLLPVAQPPPAPELAGWGRYLAGAAFGQALLAGRAARAVWQALPGEDWPARLAELAAAALSAGRGSVLVVPDHRDLARLDAALTAVLGPGRHVALAADLGPAERYRRWLAVRRGAVRVVAGTRAAGFAPVADPGLLAIWDDGDDLHLEPRAPYPHARDLLVLRAHLAGAAAVVGGFARTVQGQQLVDTGWARSLVASRETVRAAAPRVTPVGEDSQLARDPAALAARLPSLAFQAAREALANHAPVLVQVPRRGYIPSLACATCRAPARCGSCAGPLAATSGHALPSCRWCGRLAGDWQCPTCAGRRFRAVVVGSARTAEELGRAFPGATLRTSGGPHVLADIPPGAALVVATPGAEPYARDGYGAALLLDGWALLTRPDLRSAEEALRRWCTAAALVRPGAPVVVSADPGVPAVQALLRWDPVTFASRELAERTELAFPPAARFAALTGAAEAVADLVGAARLPDSAEQLGPVPVEGSEEPQERLLIRVPRPDGGALARALHDAAAVRSARKAAHPVRVQLDPADLI